MIIVKYFKTSMWGDCYVANENYMNIVSISEKEVRMFADNEKIFGGAYKEIKIPKNKFEKMINLAKNKKRKELTNLLKLVHEKNKKQLDNIKNPCVKIKEDHLNSPSLANYFFNAKTILE